jgi:trigger factor
MKVETEQLTDSQVSLSFEVEDARVERAMDAAYKRLANRVNIAGFRRGKAPRQLVERVVGRESLLEEALNQLLPEVYQEALKETNVHALTPPEFDVESLSPLKAKATVVVPPTVELGDYQGITRVPEPVTVKPEEVDEVLNQLRESRAEWVPVEEPANLGDLVVINVMGTVEDRTVFQNDDVDYVLLAGSTAPLPGFSEQLVGIAAGETREFELDVPKEESEEEQEEGSGLAGKAMHFQVTANDVKRKELPELDDYFATTVGEYENLEALRTQIESNLRERTEVTKRNELESEIVTAAVDGAKLEVPDKLVHQQAHRALDRLAQDLDSRGISIEQYLRITRTDPEEFEERYHTDAERQLRRGFVLQAIAERESLEITDEEIDTGIREALEVDGSDQRAITRALRQEEIRSRARTALIEQKAARWLVDHATTAEPPPAPAKKSSSRKAAPAAEEQST